MALREQAISLQAGMRAYEVRTSYDLGQTDGPISDNRVGRRVRITRVIITEYPGSQRIDVRLDGYRVNRDNTRDRRNSTGDTASDPALEEAYYAAHLFASGQVN